MHRLHDEIVAYTIYMEPTIQEGKARQAILDCIQNVAKGFVDGWVDLFGSCATGLWLPTRCVVVPLAIFMKFDIPRNQAILTSLFQHHRFG